MQSTPVIARAFTNSVAMWMFKQNSIKKNPKSEFYHPLHDKIETLPDGNQWDNLKTCPIGMLWNGRI